MKRAICYLLTAAMVCSLILTYDHTSYAMTVEKTVTKYHLDIGVQQIWGVADDKGNVMWDDNIGLGSDMTVSTSITFPQPVFNVEVYEYSPSKFKWSQEGYSCNIGNKKTYDDLYAPYTSKQIKVTSKGGSGSTVSFSHKALMQSDLLYNLADMLNQKRINEVFDLMDRENGEVGVKKNFPELYDKMNAGRNGVDSHVRAFMFFTPVIIQYDVKETVEIGDFEPNLDLPVSAKQGDKYSVSDATILDKSITIDHAVLEKHYGDGSWQHVANWPGPGKPGMNTGGRVEESSDHPCTIAYHLTVWDKAGEQKSVIKYISINDGREIDGKAILRLPEYTYEGHPTLAEDLSEFTVDGKKYSAKRAYEEGVADNYFAVIPSNAGDARRNRDKITADVVFPKKGYYNVQLEINTATGGFLTDIKPIEVRKTPYIEASLNGFQKENRKQILDLHVATYPDKPIVDYDIRIRDMKTGDDIILTKSQPQQNNATIKTRTVKSSGDKYFTDYTVEFLTKNTQEQEYRYTATVTDSKGDTDTVQKVFTVKPDLPPNPIIVIQDSFLRNKGTNIAEITTEDASTTDGDQLERTWSVGGVNVNTLDGYRDLAFGTGQKVKFNKTGVGKTAVNLYLKDVWIEPTLEEYVTDADRKTAATVKTTDVINIAPTVRLEPKPMRETDISIITDKAHKTEIGTAVNTLKAALIEKGFDPHISLAVAADAYSGTFRQVGEMWWADSMNCRQCLNNSTDEGNLKMDSDYVYRVVSPGMKLRDGGYYDECFQDRPHVLEAVGAGNTANSGYTKWSYPVNESRNFSIHLDDKEKYVYISCYDTNTTTVLNRDSGTFAARLSVAVGNLDPNSYGEPNKHMNLFINNDYQSLYVVRAFEIKKYDLSSGKLSTVLNRGGSPAKLVDGRVAFIGRKEPPIGYNKSGNGFYLGKYDMDSETIEETAVPELPQAEGAISAIDFSNKGEILFRQTVQEYAWREKNEGPWHHIYSFWMADINTKAVRMEKNVDSGDVNATMASWGWNGDWGKTSLGMDFYEPFVWSNRAVRLRLYRSELPELDAKTYALRKQGSPGGGSAEKYAVVAGDTGSDWILQAGSFQDEMALRGSKGLFHNVKNSITAVSDKIVELGEGLKSVLLLEGDNHANKASVNRDFQLQPDTSYEYEYKLSVPTGTAIDVFGIKNPNGKGLANDGKYFERTAAFINFNHGYTEPFFSISGGRIYAPSDGVGGKSVADASGYGSEVAGNNSSGFGASFVMQKEGYVEFKLHVSGVDMRKDDYSGPHSATVYLDGKPGFSISLGNKTADYKTTLRAYVSPGSHSLYINHSHVGIWGSDFASINNLKAVYLEDTADGFVPVSVPAAEGKEQKISGTFSLAGNEKVQLVSDQTKALTMRQEWDYAQYVTSYIEEAQYNGDAGTTRALYSGPIRFDASTGAWKSQEIENGFISGWYRITAPSDRFLLYTLDTTYQYGKLGGGGLTDSGAEEFVAGSGIYVLRPGQSRQINFTLSRTWNSTFRKWSIQSAKISNVKIAEFSVWDFGGTDAVRSAAFNVSNGTLATPSTGGYILSSANPSPDNVRLRYYSELWQDSTLNSGISLSTSTTAQKISALVSDFRLYQKLGGVRQLVFSQDFSSQRALDLTGWKTAAAGGGKSQIITVEAPKKEEDAPLVYKKGQLVAYNIFYDDYENDLSKKQYWRYTHMPYNDGPHPQAAFILNEDGNVVSSTGAVLSESIPRFYIDGKYTVEHWQEDNTNRNGGGGTSGGASGETDYTKYDKLSNVESITFYIEGGASAPWITSIKTIPATVKEGTQYRLQIGVDDLEKDELRLTTELYKDKKLIYTHKQNGIVADASGNYPLTTTGYPPLAEAGKYEVVCTVRDWSGAGLGTYTFTVVSEGKITGWVNHTPQWDENRKKYNLKRFSDEVNRISLFHDYKTLTAPRPRGTNVFWSGEKFMLSAETEGTPSRVSVDLMDSDSSGGFRSTEYSAVLTKTGTGSGRTEQWQGSLWDRTMINRWGRKRPEELLFVFTAFYSGGTTKTHQVRVILDSENDYWQLHRLW